MASRAIMAELSSIGHRHRLWIRTVAWAREGGRVSRGEVAPLVARGAGGVACTAIEGERFAAEDCEEVLVPRRGVEGQAKGEPPGGRRRAGAAAASASSFGEVDADLIGTVDADDHHEAVFAGVVGQLHELRRRRGLLGAPVVATHHRLATRIDRPTPAPLMTRRVALPKIALGRRRQGEDEGRGGCRRRGRTTRTGSGHGARGWPCALIFAPLMLDAEGGVRTLDGKRLDVGAQRRQRLGAGGAAVSRWLLRRLALVARADPQRPTVRGRSS